MARVARQNLLQGQFGPLEAHRHGKFPVGDASIEAIACPELIPGSDAPLSRPTGYML